MSPDDFRGRLDELLAEFYGPEHPATDTAAAAPEIWAYAAATKLIASRLSGCNLSIDEEALVIQEIFDRSLERNFKDHATK